MKERLSLKNLDACLEMLNNRGDMPADLFFDSTSGDVWIPDYPKECEYTVQFCPAVRLVHEFPSCDLKTYTEEDIILICENAISES